MIEDKIRLKIQNLIDRSGSITVGSHGLARDDKHLAQCKGWVIETVNVIEFVIPNTSNAYRRMIIDIAESRGSELQKVASIGQTLSSMLPDIDYGLLGDIGNKARAETFDDFLDHAIYYHKEKKLQESGVISGVVFEDTIRRIYRSKISDDKDKSVEDIINDLARNDLLTGQQGKQAKVAAHVRTKATHAQWDEFDLDGVAQTIAFTKILLRDHLGG